MDITLLIVLCCIRFSFNRLEWVSFAIGFEEKEYHIVRESFGRGPWWPMVAESNPQFITTKKTGKSVLQSQGFEYELG